MQDVDSRSRPFGNLLHFDADKFPFSSGKTARGQVGDFSGSTWL